MAVLATSAEGPTSPWSSLGDHGAAVLSGDSAGYLAVAVLGTALLAGTGIDDSIQRRFQRENPLGATFADGAYLSGYVWPAALAGGLYWRGRIGADEEAVVAGSAAIQSLGLALALTATGKLLTGRRGPIKTDCGLFCSGEGERAVDSRDFDPALWRRDIPWELFWPSGHAAAAAAVISSQAALYPERRWIAWAGYGVAALMGVGLVEGDFHWTSDVLAGLLVGHAVGRAVGEGFRAEIDRGGGRAGAGLAPTSQRVAFLPIASGRGGVGVSLALCF